MKWTSMNILSSPGRNTEAFPWQRDKWRDAEISSARDIEEPADVRCSASADPLECDWLAAHSTRTSRHSAESTGRDTLPGTETAETDE